MRPDAPGRVAHPSATGRVEGRGKVRPVLGVSVVSFIVPGGLRRVRPGRGSGGPLPSSGNSRKQSQRGRNGSEVLR